MEAALPAWFEITAYVVLLLILSADLVLAYKRPLRALVAFDMTFLTMLVAVFFIWLFFNDLFLLWHNRIQSERNLSTLLAEAPAWAVLFFLLGSFFLVMWLFANYYLTAYA